MLCKSTSKRQLDHLQMLASLALFMRKWVGVLHAAGPLIGSVATDKYGVAWRANSMLILTVI